MVRIYLVSSLVFLSACSPLFVARAGIKQLTILNAREPIQDVIDHPRTKPLTKQKLERIQEARETARSVGLDVGGSFSSYAEIGEDPVTWVLTASPSYELDPVTWWFPIVGSIPYKGFFSNQEALKEARELNEDGFDTNVRPSLAYSTLGWFDDPILSSALVLDEISLVDLVIHESFHNTVWVRDHVAFNESAANAIGGLGSYYFFSRRNADAEAQLALHRWKDFLRLSEFVSSLADALEVLYEEIEAKSEDEKAQAKDALLTRYQTIWNEEVSKTLLSDSYSSVDKWLNNAALIGLKLYTTRLTMFDQLYQCLSSDYLAFVQALVSISNEAEEQDKEPFNLVTDYLKQENCSQRSQVSFIIH